MLAIEFIRAHGMSVGIDLGNFNDRTRELFLPSDNIQVSYQMIRPLAQIFTM